jgi:ABC-2 type transport system ATP-binding protein
MNSFSDSGIALQVSHLSKQFDKLTAVNNISFDIRQHEIFGLLGPNGAGKTTTINMVCGLIPPSSGSVTFPAFHGRDSRTLIGYCPQENIFYPKLSCLEQLIFTGQTYNISYRIAKKQALDLLEMLGLKEKTHVFASKLSGGMKRRLNICLALIHDPQVLILDEPEAGLDPQSRILVREFIQHLGKQKTVLLTTHNMDEADRLADRIAIMDQGKILTLDTSTNLKKSIGNDNILEIDAENNATAANAVKVLNQYFENTNITNMDSKVIIRHSDIIGILPEVQRIAERSGLKISEFRIRENTLEDVFIHLTGKNLRI